MKNYTKGISKLAVIIIVAVVALLTAGAVYYYATKQPQPQKLPNEFASSTPSQPSDTIASNEPANTTTIKNMSHKITITTSKGSLSFVTYDIDAPNTVNNFITLANKGFYNGVIFHRVIPGFMIQGGDPTGTGTGGPGYQFADELNPNTDSYKTGYKKGIVAMANAGPNTNGSQFFIMVADYPLQNNYTIFGNVVSGQDVADAISNVKTGANDKPVDKVVMEKVTVEDNPAK